MKYLTYLAVALIVFGFTGNGYCGDIMLTGSSYYGEELKSGAYEKHFGTVKGFLVDSSSRKPITTEPTLVRVQERDATDEDRKRIQVAMDTIKYKGGKNGSFIFTKVIPGRYALFLYYPKSDSYQSIGDSFIVKADATVDLGTIQVKTKK